MQALIAPVQTKYIFVLQLKSGKYVIGQSTNAARCIVAINSGHNQFVGKQPHQIERIIGIKIANEDRSLMTVVSKFCDRIGSDNVITV